MLWVSKGSGGCVLSWPRCGKLLDRTFVLSAIASRRASGFTNPAGLTTESKSATLINGNLTHFITRSSLSWLALHQLQTPRKISTSGAKKESLWSSSTSDACKQGAWLGERNGSTKFFQVNFFLNYTVFINTQAIAPTVVGYPFNIYYT